MGTNPFDIESSDRSEEQPDRPSHADYLGGGQSAAQVIITALLVIIAFASGWFGNAYVNRNNIATGDAQLILQAWNDINQYYVVTGAINDKKMAYAAISAMVDSLGDTGHSRFETPEELAREQQQLQNAPTVGIGVYLSGGGSKPIRIDAIIPNSPASRSKLQPGDLIVGVNGKDIQGMTIDQARPLILGKKGTPVTLTIQRTAGGTTSHFDVTLTREEFTAPTVVSYIIPNLNIAYIQVLQFSSDADSQMRKALQEAKAHHVQGIILDLRDNPGGYLDQARAVASEFIKAGPNKNVLIEKSRSGQQAQSVIPGGLATDIPLTVLVNQNTASAAEIVAGAIAINRPQVHVIGETTFGTGTVLKEFMLSDGSAIWLGTEEWLLPNGESIYHKGFTPDQKVALPDNVAPVSPLVAQEQHLTAKQIINAGDTQLNTALNDLTNGQAAAAA